MCSNSEALRDVVPSRAIEADISRPGVTSRICRTNMKGQIRASFPYNSRHNLGLIRHHVSSSPLMQTMGAANDTTVGLCEPYR